MRTFWIPGLGLFLMLAGLATGTGAEPSAPALHLRQRIPLPEAHSVATDIRWASDDSVYVSWDRDGVAEVGLDGTRQRFLVPNLHTLGEIKHYTHMAASSRDLAVASINWTFAWRSLKASPAGQVLFQKQGIAITNDFDLQGDRILLMGTAKHEEPFQAKGEVAWLGTLSSKLTDLKPVLHDVDGAGAPAYRRCRAELVGAVRFLADGSFLVAPGFQDGILLYNASGRRVRAWTNKEVGLDTDECVRMTMKEENLMGTEPYWKTWLNGHRVLDDILPLPEGPGLLVRSWGTDGLVHWSLKVLRPEGVKSYTVPVVSRRSVDRLHGDVRDGKIVLLLSASGVDWSWDAANYPAEILLLELPNA
jgi:hypothetical protein